MRLRDCGRLLTVVVLATGFGGAMAQDPPSLSEPPETGEAPEPVAAPEAPIPGDTADAAIEEVIVTGTRIFSVNPEQRKQSNAVSSVSSTAVQATGAVNLTDFLKELPALTGSLDSNDAAGPNAFIGGTGLELLNLRNLGVDRTLVLVDGRRHVSSLPGSAAVDIDTIPLVLIDRIDVLTGGASAIYGADGVSGVVNFIMKRNYEGLDASAQYGLSERGDSATRLLNVVNGYNFNEGRGNFSFAAEYSSEDRLRGIDRGRGGGRQTSLVRNPFDLDDDPTIPDRIPLSDIRFFDSSRGGAVDTDFDFVQDFHGSDQPWDFGTIDFIPPFYQQGGDGTPQDDFTGDLTPDSERYTVNTMFTYKLRPEARFFSDVKYSKSRSFSAAQPSFDYFLWIDPDNAFLPPNIAAAAAAASAEAGETLPILVSRDHFDLGTRTDDTDRETVRGVIGFDGDLTDTLRYEVSYVYGRTKIDSRAGNNRYNDRFAAALDSVIDPDTGEAVCRSTLDPNAVAPNLDWQGWNSGSFTPGADSGCVPVNIFGDGAISKEAAAWINTTSLTTSELLQNVAQAYVSGDSSPLFELPAGAVSWVLGGEWRKEESKNFPPPEDRAGLTFGNVIEPTLGKYEVAEAFAEVKVPLLRDRPYADELTVDGAVRVSDYSTSGSADTWKLGFVYAPVNMVSIRGTRADATRAPNIGELFDPGGQTFEFIDDPCDVAFVDSGTIYRRDNCAAILNGFGIDPATYTDPNSSSINGTLKGNRDLDEEVANTRTLGVTVQPLANLSFSLDWYDIRLRNAINTAFPQEAADNCVDLPTIDNQFCTLVTRDPDSGGIVDFVQQPVNVARFTTRGYDFRVLYVLRPVDLKIERDIGVFRFALAGNKLDDLTFVNLPGAIPDSDLGEEDVPDLQYNFDLNWERGPVSVTYGYNYFARTQRYTDEQRAGDPDISAARYFYFSSKKTHDISARYSFPSGLSLYGGINNALDQEPDIGQSFYPVSAVGRFFFAGIQYSRPAP